MQRRLRFPGRLSVNLNDYLTRRMSFQLADGLAHLESLLGSQPKTLLFLAPPPHYPS